MPEEAPPPANLPSDDTLFQTAACALVLTDTRGLILKANPIFCSWIGRDRTQLIGKMRIQDLLTMGGKIFHQTHWHPLLQMQGSIAEVKLELSHSDGHRVPMIMNAVSRRHGDVVFHELALFVAEDRHRYEEELLRAKKRAEQLSAQLLEGQKALSIAQAAAEDRALVAEQMIGIVSHDLRNPLAAIHLGAHVLAETATDAIQLQMVGRIKNSVGRANRLIGDLLDFTQARIGRGLSVRMQAVNLHELVANSLIELSTAYPERQLRHVEVGFGPSIGDADRLAQLLGNLVSNAVAYGAKDKPITITSNLGGDSYSIEVHNEGAPIPAAVLPTLFAPMERGLDVKNENKSVGLGLFIVKQIATAHLGEVRVTSSAEDGTRFSVVVPSALE